MKDSTLWFERYVLLYVLLSMKLSAFTFFISQRERDSKHKKPKKPKPAHKPDGRARCCSICWTSMMYVMGILPRSGCGFLENVLQWSSSIVGFGSFSVFVQFLIVGHLGCFSRLKILPSFLTTLFLMLIFVIAISILNISVVHRKHKQWPQLLHLHRRIEKDIYWQLWYLQLQIFTSLVLSNESSCMHRNRGGRSRSLIWAGPCRKIYSPFRVVQPLCAGTGSLLMGSLVSTY